MSDMEVTYVVIPGEVAFNPDLTLLDMFVFWMVNSLSSGGSDRVCNASNQYIAGKLRANPNSIARSVSKLVEMGYLNRSISGNRRHLSINSNYMSRYASLITSYNEVNQTVKVSLTRRLIYNKSNISNDYLKVVRPGKPALPKRRIFGRRREEKLRRIVKHWNSFGKPFVRHNFDSDSKTMRKIRKLLLIEIDKQGAGKICAAMSNWRDLMFNSNTVLNRNYNFLKRQSMVNFLRPDSRTLSQIRSHKPDLDMTSPYREALKGYEHIVSKFGRTDEYPQITEEIMRIWLNKHSVGNRDDFESAASKWAKRFQHWTLALEGVDALEYVLNLVPEHYNSNYINTNQFWGDFLPEKLKMYDGGYD